MFSLEDSTKVVSKLIFKSGTYAGSLSKCFDFIEDSAKLSENFFAIDTLETITLNFSLVDRGFVATLLSS